MRITICLNSFEWYDIYRWLLPKETGYPLAAGNQASCVAQGYLMIFFLGACATFRCVLALTCEFKCVIISFFVYSIVLRRFSCLVLRLCTHLLTYSLSSLRLVNSMPREATEWAKRQILDILSLWLLLGIWFGLCSTFVDCFYPIRVRGLGILYGSLWKRARYKVVQSVGNSWSTLWCRFGVIVVFLHYQFSTIYSPYREANG